MIDRDKSAEFENAKQCFNEELEFRVRSQRNRLLGRWTAAKLGLSGAEADAYERSIVVLGIEHAADHALLRHIVQETRASSVPCSEKAVRSEMDRLSQIAASDCATKQPRSRPKAA